ncbi:MULTISPECIES: hypothetical protein [Luteibacter]|uniref:hypothetical protein n=1 Tax=Luteibacter sp. dw_328 TaxID=2719796 RepID=UPI0007BF18A5|nr:MULTISPECIES: hypothetical protein [Luteibacter]
MPENALLDDANVESIDIDAVNRILRIRVNRYEAPDSKQRIQATVQFGNVQSFSGTLNLMAFLSNAWDGHIQYWQPSTGFGLSYVYFARGVFSIHSDEPFIL